MFWLRSRETVSRCLLVVAVLNSSCREPDDLVAPSAQLRTADEELTVLKAEPSSAKRGTTLNIRVTGSGFEAGSVVGLERQGVPADGITTNSTTYVTSTQLVANVTIAVHADTGRYDVTVVTPRRRKGVGAELFDVLHELLDIGVIGGTWSMALAINDLGHVVGTSCTQTCASHAFFWSETGGLEDLGTIPGYSRSAAFSINTRGQVLGAVGCYASDFGCDGKPSGEAVIWERDGGQWRVIRLGISAFVGDGEKYGDINNAGQLVMMGTLYSLPDTAGEETQTLFRSRNRAPGMFGLAVREPLPQLAPTARNYAVAINDLGVVAGRSNAEPVIWFRDLVGTWQILRLGNLPGNNFALLSDLSEVDAVGRIRIVGISGQAGGSGAYPVRWTPERDGGGRWRVLVIEALEVPSKAYQGARVSGVNAAGEAVGDYTYRGEGGYGILDAVKWLPSGTVETLLPAPVAGLARARAINNKSRIVGSVWDDTQACERAAFWRPRQPGT